MIRIDFIEIDSKIVVRYNDNNQRYFLKEIVNELDVTYSFNASLQDAKLFDDLASANAVVDMLFENSFNIVQSRFL